MPVSFSKFAISTVLPAVKMEGIIMFSLSVVRPFDFMYALAPLTARSSAVAPAGACAEATVDPARSTTIARTDSRPRARFMRCLLEGITSWAS